MAKRYKMTGCAKLFIVLLVVAPIAYFVASYVNGKDPIGEISGWFGSERTEDAGANGVSSGDTASEADLLEQIRKLEKDVEYYKVEAESYKSQLEECEATKN
ncbi:hypothetical protein [Membranihabitans maritimus]|uniref:hypothetical protein n=1 Tax=Membranihabitans maritimus TaxID=2904244 RepID=UPI001F459C11|nr:hypothetical protein [Membranihabitans maritimus]